MLHYLYRITNEVNGKVYIGQSQNPGHRWSNHKYFARYPEKTNQYIHKAMAKHGVENFTLEVIASCQTHEDADDTEIYLIQQYGSLSSKCGYNLHSGGAVHSGFKFSEETKRMMSEHWHVWHTPESIEKVAEATRNRIVSNETRAKQSASMKGKQNRLGQHPADLEKTHRLQAIQAHFAETLGDTQCSVPNCSETSRVGNRFVAGKRYCNLHGQRLMKTGTTEALRRVAHNKTIFTDEQLNHIAADARSCVLIAHEFGVGAGVIQRLRASLKRKAYP